MKIIIAAILSAFALIYVIASFETVPAGNVGVVVYLLGGDKGVDSEEIGVGRKWVGMNEKLYIFPTFTQNHVWTKAATEGSSNDDSFTFQTMEGMSVNTDVGIAYHINPKKVSTVFQRYRKGVDEITNIVLRNAVRDAFNKEASKIGIESVYGAGKSKLMTDVYTEVNNRLMPDGIEVENIFLVGEMRLPETVTQAINAKIRATQMAQQRENEIQQTKAEAQKVMEAANGEANSKLTLARAEAESVRVKGEAEAFAIKAKSDALNTSPQLVQYEIAKNWNGQLPTTTGGAIPLLNLK